MGTASPSAAASGVRAVVSAVTAVAPCDELEAEHLATTLAWIDSGAALYRTEPPDVPPMHLVSYFVPFDARSGSVLVGVHRKSGLDLPPGGHCEPGESPWETACRECVEELGIPAVALPQIGPRPLLLTVTRTRGGLPGRHTDVSLWYVLEVARDDPALRADPGEFSGVRWVSLDALLAEPIERFDPHMHRFARKLLRTSAAR